MNGYSTAPILPARDLDETFEFYKRLGFERLGGEYDHYLMIIRDQWELHFFLHPELKIEESFSAAYLRIREIGAIDTEWAKLDLPSEGAPRLMRAEMKDWGMIELALVDPNGTLLRVGQHPD